VIDESHIFCPEKGQSEATDSVIELATLGRKRGFGCILATQRLSKLHKDASAECNNKLIGRTTQDIDIKRSAEELGISSREKRISLRNLKPGEFFAYGPAISQDVIKVKIGTVETSHIEPGDSNSYTKPAPTAKIKAALKSLADLPQGAAQEAKTIEEYQQQIIRLKRQLREKGGSANTTKVTPSRKTVDAAVQKALKAQVVSFTKEKERLIIYANVLRYRIKEMQKTLKTMQDEPLPDIPYDASLSEKTGQKIEARDDLLAQETPQQVQNGHNTSQNIFVMKWLQKLDQRSSEMLQYIAGVYPNPITRKELGIKMGISAKGGHFHRILQKLRRNHLVEINFATDEVRAKNELFG
jgi:hypothetical protein